MDASRPVGKRRLLRDSNNELTRQLIIIKHVKVARRKEKYTF